MLIEIKVPRDVPGQSQCREDGTMTDSAYQQLILDALRNPATWPNYPEKVDMIETHAALIFLAGDECV